jgi:hypothetical protein
MLLSYKALSNSLEVHISQNKRKKLTNKCKKSIFSKMLNKKFSFERLSFLKIFYLIIGLNPHIHIFFQLCSCTGGSTIRVFKFKKTFFGPFHFS